ncbi:MAG: hypothetical protein QOE08_756 [Thermoleophilaceae bacterium]|nr:hypothetical protein [Thermoleophilaceae bacterium]
MTATAAQSPPASLRKLVERFDPDAFDAPRGRARVRLEVTGQGAWNVDVKGDRIRLGAADEGDDSYDAKLSADAAAWMRMSTDLVGGMTVYRAGRLHVRRNLHIGVGFLAAASGDPGPGRLRFDTVKTDVGKVSMFEAGEGEPLLLLHGLGATKASFLPTVAALAPERRVIAIDQPGFGDSDKPFPASYDAAFFARWVCAFMDSQGIDRAHVLGHSMGGRVALELGMRNPERVEGLILMTPSLAWRGSRPWVAPLKLIRPELGLLQPTPRPVVEAFVRRFVPDAESSWVASGVDEFLRAYLNPRGRVAFYAAARNIYLENPDGFWSRLEALEARSLFIWGRRDTLVPIGFSRHVRKALPDAKHVELDCGHVPQLERPRAAHGAIARFLRGDEAAHNGRSRAATGVGPRSAQSGAS